MDQEKYNDYRWMCKRIKELAMLPDVFICANDEIAVTLIRALREIGLTVPEDVKVVGFDDMPVAASRYTYVHTTPVFRESTGILHE